MLDRFNQELIPSPIKKVECIQIERMMLCCKRIGFVLSIFILLGINLSSLNGVYQLTNPKISAKLGNSVLSNQEGSEFLPDNSTWSDYPIDDDQNGY
jgi:hypothetical protein